MIDFDVLYSTLIAVAARGGQISYGDLSREYYRMTNIWVDPHLEWNDPLGQLNQRLHEAGFPALSAVVIVNDDDRQPGSGFWGSCPSVPPRPHRLIDRINEYARLLGDVHVRKWPPRFP